MINVNACTREQMEEFTYAIIRHGNNGAARWFTNRPEFYELHDLINRGLPTEDDVVNFLFEHQAHCKSKDCKCSDILANEVPALTKEYAA